MIKVLSCITGQHSIPLVLLAAAVCAFGSFTALSLLERARDQKKDAIDWRWLIAASAVAAAAVWSTHFVAMLAYGPDALTLGYEVGLTALSIAIAMVVTLAGLPRTSIGVMPRWAARSSAWRSARCTLQAWPH